jgi:hypothetical protein
MDIAESEPFSFVKDGRSDESLFSKSGGSKAWASKARSLVEDEVELRQHSQSRQAP